jgi:hypothetical protein
MAHEIMELDTVLSTSGTEWHGLAKHVDSIGEAEIAPLLFDIVSGQPSVTVEDGTSIPMEGHKMLVAKLPRFKEDGITPVLLGVGKLATPVIDYHPLYVPKASYEVITNREVYEMAKESFESLGCKLVTAGTLGNLSKFFMSIDIGEKEFKASNGDLFENYLNFITSHDGTYALECYDSSIRIVCMNTFRWSRETAGEIGVKMYHTKNVSRQMEKLPEYLAALVNNRRKLVEGMNYLLDVECSPTQSAYIASGYFHQPLPGVENPKTELSTTAFNRANAVRDLSIVGKGNRGKTLYDLFNGFTEFFTSGDGAGGVKASAGKRQSVARFGMAADHKDQFLNILLDSNRTSELEAVGEKLYRDKVLASN